MTALPRLKARVKLNFPAVVSGVDGISVTKQNGEYSIGLAVDQLIDTPTLSDANSSSYRIPVYDSLNDTYSSLAFTNLAVGIEDSVFPVSDESFVVEDSADATKRLKLQLSGITTATTRTLTVPNADTTIVGIDTAQTLSNKTIGVTNDILSQDAAFGIVDNGDNTKIGRFELSGLSTATTRTLAWPDANGTVAVSAASPITLNSSTGQIGITGSSLTRVDDTNVTLTLGGAPSTALLAATSITAGWSGQLSPTRGGTGSNLSATGGAGQVLKQTSVGGNVTVDTVAASEISSPASLTKTDDTNVTLALGGTPSASLLAATSLTLGWSGQLAVSRGGTGLASGTSGGILGFTASGTLASSATLGQYGVVIGGGAGATPTAITAGTNGQLLLGVTSAAPAMATMSGDATIANTGALTIANSAVTNAKIANSAAYSLKGNFTGSSAAPQDATIGGLTQKVSPASTDLLLLQDQAASGQLKYATVSSVSSAGSVASIAGNTGAFTLSTGITNSGNDIRLSLANASLLVGPTNPTGTTSLTPVMMGLGVSSCRITPVYSSRVFFTIQGVVMNNTASDAASVRLYQGSGAGPANGAAITGTAYGTAIQAGGGSGNANVGFPFTLSTIVTGLTPGTTYWFDIAVAAVVGGTASVSSLTASCLEF